MTWFRRGAHRQNGFRITVAELVEEFRWYWFMERHAELWNARGYVTVEVTP